jgi:hypothetical protein
VSALLESRGARLVSQAQTLVWLRTKLWMRALSQERTFGRFLFQAVVGLFAFTASCFMAFALWHALAIEYGRNPAEVRANGGPLAIGALWLTLGFVMRLYVALLSLAQGKPFLDPRRFLIYAVPGRLVSFINIAAQLFEPVWVLFYPLAVGFVLGLSRIPGAPGVVPLAFAVALLIVASASFLHLALAVLTEIGSHKLLRRVLFVGMLGGVGLFMSFVNRLKKLDGDSLELLSWPLLHRLPPGWAVELAAALTPGRGDPSAALGPLCLLVSIIGLSYLLAHRLALREARRPDELVRAGPVGEGPPGWKLPFFSEPVSALLEKETKTVLRAGWQQLLIAPASFFFLRIAVLRDGPAMAGPQPFLIAAGYAHLGVLAYAINCFGWDLEASRGYFLWPVRGRTVLLAKNAVAYGLSLLLFLGISAVVFATGRRDLSQIAVGLIAHAATFPVLAALGNAASLFYPSPMRAARLRRSPGSATALVRMGAMLLLVGAGWAPYVVGNALRLPLLFVYAGELVVMAVVYGGLLSASEAVLGHRKELILKGLARDE